MKILALEARPDAKLAHMLQRFEQQFSYPLGNAQHFHVVHGDDYPLFFRAMGRARCFLAQREGEIVGALAVVIRRAVLPDGNEEEVGYLGDLKIAPHARGGRVLLRLAAAAAAWAPRTLTSFFGVVMDGTAATPDRYTGRIGLPAFEALARVVVARFSTNDFDEAHNAGVVVVESQVGNSCFRELSAGRYSTPYANAAERSLVAPEWLMQKDGSACACLEDTRRAKRLVLADGAEMISAHLSCFAYRDIGSGAVIIRAAVNRARIAGFPALFVALSTVDSPRLLGALGEHRATLASATVFGHGLKENVEWNINTAEI